MATLCITRQNQISLLPENPWLELGFVWRTWSHAVTRKGVDGAPISSWLQKINPFVYYLSDSVGLVAKSPSFTKLEDIVAKPKSSSNCQLPSAYRRNSMNLQEEFWEQSYIRSQDLESLLQTQVSEGVFILVKEEKKQGKWATRKKKLLLQETPTSRNSRK